jgi:L-ascorbate metabolism protein UlaG (beta-lactamase superfamily)
VNGLTLFFDTYLDDDRAPGGAIVGQRAADVDEAEYCFISHAHFDHVLGADTIATRTGATVVGSYEVARVLRENGVPEAQLLPVAGGEPVDCGNDVRVRVLPSLHSCLYTSGSRDSGTECFGDLAVSAQDRLTKVRELQLLAGVSGGAIEPWFATSLPRFSLNDGGQLAFLLETAEGSIFVSSSAGYWSGIVRNLRPALAILAASGRPNIDGEPNQGSLAQFLIRQIEALQPDAVAFSHHDALMPPFLAETDLSEATSTIRRQAPQVTLLDLTYSEPVPVL